MKETAATRAVARRVELGLTQKQVADAYGTRQECISQWENDGARTLQTIERLAWALWCEPAWLAFGVGPKHRKVGT